MLIRAIEVAWTHIQAAYPDVPDVFTTLASGPKKYGHFAESRWVKRSDLPDPPPPEGVGVEVAAKHELFIGGELLYEGAGELFATLLHEAVHGIAVERGVQDTSRQGRYHNAQFKELAQEVGLEVDKDQSIGWSLTRVPGWLSEKFGATIASLDEALSMVRLADVKGENAAKQPVPECACPRKIRVSKKVLEEGPIWCSVCNEKFEIRKVNA